MRKKIQRSIYLEPEVSALVEEMAHANRRRFSDELSVIIEKYTKLINTQQKVSKK
jgi:hypothetical protein